MKLFQPQPPEKTQGMYCVPMFNDLPLTIARHTVDVDAKRYFDVLLNGDEFKSGVWWGSKKWFTGKLADQIEH